MEFDDIIVGSGSSGAVLAARLSEDAQRKVLLIEAGPDYAAIEKTPASLLDGRWPAADHEWGYTAEMVPDIRRVVSHYVHPVGTARMGPDGDPGAVVDQWCRVRGVSQLRVVDASVMPTVPRANTHLTCMMIGERVAEWMRDAPA